MGYRIVEIRHIRDYTVHVRFNDGVEGDIDLRGKLDGEVFEPLRDIALFKQLSLDPATHTIVWPNGADLAPEYLREKIHVEA